MNPARPIFAILGLICIALFYVFRNADFLGLAVILFAVGLVFMGAFRRRKQIGDAGKKRGGAKQKS